MIKIARVLEDFFHRDPVGFLVAVGLVLFLLLEGLSLCKG